MRIAVKKHRIYNIVALVLVAVLCVAAGREFLAMHADEAIAPNPSLTQIKKLSDWNADLKGSAGDSDVYVFQGAEPGGKILILGGTHANEIAATAAAVALIENIQVQKGTVYVIPHANNSGITHTLPLEGAMDFYTVTLADGSARTFRDGSRRSNPVHQWPDPNYYMGSSGRELVNDETAEIRNLNRNHPGEQDSGYLTQRACYAIYNLIMTEGIDVLYDGHEASPEFPRVNYMIAHNNAMPLASMTSVNLMLDGVTMMVDLSGAASFGLSHRALGDNTPALATLVETMNPVMGPMHGKVTRDLVVGGQDRNYLSALGQSKAVSAGGTSVTPTNGNLDYRVAYHAAIYQALTEALAELYPDKAIVFTGLPDYTEMVDLGVGGLLKPLG